MKRNINPTLSLMAAVAFAIAAVIMWITDLRHRDYVAPIAMSIAAILWFIVALRARMQNG